MALTIPASAQAWIAVGERGLSSCAIFEHMTGLRLHEPTWGGIEHNYPHDPDDVRRCRLLLDAVPEFRARFHEMMAHGPRWTALVVNWLRICDLIDEEKHTGRCTKAYDLMCELEHRRPTERTP